MEIAEHGENEAARVAAANAVLDRGWGRGLASSSSAAGRIPTSRGAT
jgi:hypothetical protein